MLKTPNHASHAERSEATENTNSNFHDMRFVVDARKRKQDMNSQFNS
jgi:hypothetical protein